MNCFSLFSTYIFHHSEKRKLPSSVFPCSYVSSPPPLNTVEYFETMSPLFSCTVIYSQQTSSAGERINITCVKVSLLLVCYPKTVPKFPFSNLHIPLITGMISLKRELNSGSLYTLIAGAGGHSRGSVVPVPSSSVTLLWHTSRLYR